MKLVCNWKKILWTSLLMILCVLACPIIAHAEGSKDLVDMGDESMKRPFLECFDYVDKPTVSKLAGLERNTEFKVYVKKGENVYLGSSNIGNDDRKSIQVVSPKGIVLNIGNVTTTAGYIKDRAAEKAGPRIPGVQEGADCFEPLSFTADTTGFYTVSFFQGSQIDSGTSAKNPPEVAVSAPFANAQTIDGYGYTAAWDVTVVNKDNQIEEGRMFTDAIFINNGGQSKLGSSFSVLTDDGFIYKLKFNDIEPWGFAFFANKRGPLIKNIVDGEVIVQSAYHSFRDADSKLKNINTAVNADINGTIVNIDPYDAELDSTYRLFLNEPSDEVLKALNITEVTALGDIKPGTFKFEGNSDKAHSTFVNQGGIFSFEIEDNCLATSFEIQINLTSPGSSETKTLILGNAIDKSKDLQEVYWDGKDSQGNIVGAGSYAVESLSLTLLAGEVHFPLFDVEQFRNGITVSRKTGETATGESIYEVSDICYNNSLTAENCSIYDKTNSPSTPIVNGLDRSTTPEKENACSSNRTNGGNNAVVDLWTHAIQETKDEGLNIINVLSSLAVAKYDGAIPEEQRTDRDILGGAEYRIYNEEGKVVYLKKAETKNEYEYVGVLNSTEDALIDSTGETVSLDGCVNTFVTVASKKVNITGLPVLAGVTGHHVYGVQEVNAPDGYVINKNRELWNGILIDAKIELSGDPAKENKLILIDEVKLPRLDIYKRSAVTGDNSILGDAVFEMMHDDKRVYFKESADSPYQDVYIYAGEVGENDTVPSGYVTELVTVKNRELHIFELPYTQEGIKYVLREIKAPDGYIKNSSPISLTYKGEYTTTGGVEGLTNLTIRNNLDTVVELSKYERNSLESPQYIIGGAEFQVYKSSDASKPILFRMDDSGEYIYTEEDTDNNATDTVITESKQSNLVLRLPLGDYLAVETKAPAGYAKATDLTFTVKQNEVTIFKIFEDRLETPLIDLEGSKTWVNCTVDGQLYIPNEIETRLYADGNMVMDPEDSTKPYAIQWEKDTENHKWTFVIENMEAKNAEGFDIDYEIKEGYIDTATGAFEPLMDGDTITYTVNGKAVTYSYKEEGAVSLSNRLISTVNVDYQWRKGSAMPAAAQLPEGKTIITASSFTADATYTDGVTSLNDYIFHGWYTDEECTNKFVDGSPINKDTVLYGYWMAAQVNVSYAWKTGSDVPSLAVLPKTDTIDINTGYKAANVTEVSNYDFHGWFTDEDCTIAYEDGSKIESDTVLYGCWEKRTARVVYAYGTDSAITDAGLLPVDDTEYDVGTAYTAKTITPKTGYTFNGWYKDEACTTKFTNGTALVDGVTTLYGKFVENTYTIAYEYVGTYDDAIETIPEAPASVTKGYNDKYTVDETIPAKTLQYYEFEGWYSDAACTTKVSGEQTLTKNVTYYGKWVRKTVEVTYYFTEDSVIPAGVTVPEKQTVDMGATYSPESMATKAGYTFNGWYTDEELTTAFDSTKPIEANTDLYGEWSKNSYTVTYEYVGEAAEIPEDAPAVPAQSTAEYGATHTIDTTVPVADVQYYDFAGWYSDAACTTKVTGEQTVTADVTYYGKWVRKTVEVTYHLTENSVTPEDVTVPETQTVGMGTTYTPESLGTKPGYTFNGWYTDGELTTEFDSTMPIEANTDLYGEWSKDSYTVTYEYVGEAAEIPEDAPAVPAQSVAEYGDPHTVDTTVSAADVQYYDFAGWYSDAACTEKVDGEQTVTSNVTYYGKWVRKTLPVTYHYTDESDTPTGADLPADERAELGNTYVPVMMDEKPGYTFDGWYIDEELTTEFDSTEPVTEAIELYGVWTKSKYTVQYEYVGSDVPAEAPSVPESDTLEYEGIHTVDTTVPATEVEHYTFDGWYSNEECTMAVSGDQTITSSVTYYGKWVKDNLNVSYEYGIDSVITDEDLLPGDRTIGYGDAFTTDEVVVPDGYYFVGWYTDAECSNKFADGTSLTEDTVLYGVFKENEPDYITVTYHFVSESDVPDGVLLPNPEQIVKGNTYSAVILGSVEGYTFNGWYLDEELEEPYDDSMPVEDDFDLYGAWTEITVDPTPEDPTPEDPTPEDPTPEDPTPEDPTPEDPTPEDPTPEDPTPEDPTPEDPTPEKPIPEKPVPEKPTVNEQPENSPGGMVTTEDVADTGDTTDIVAPIMLMTLSFISASVLIVCKRRNKN